VDGATGIAAARSTMPELIVCDIQLPGIDGYEVARLLKADPAYLDVPLVAVTALAMVGDRDQILAAGFDGYITKPIMPETFVAQLEAFLRPTQRTAQTPLPTSGNLDTPDAPSPPTGATILVVDDRFVNRELARTILEPSGYRVILAEGVRQALELARTHLPDLIVSDMHMPEMDGFDLLRAIKSDPQLRGLKVVIHSATIGSEHYCREAIRLGALKCITRPVEPQMLLAEIEACLNQEVERRNGDDPHS
jgi:two-component system cell cycle response regulator